MWKNLFKYLLIAMFASFIAIGCGLEGDDGDDGARGPAGKTGPQGPAGESAAAQVSVMEDGHQKVFNSAEDTNFAAQLSSVTPNSDNTTTITFSVTKNGDAYTGGFADWTGGDNWDAFNLMWTSYDNDNGSFSDYEEAVFSGGDVENNGDGTYTVTFEPSVEMTPNMTFFLVGAKADGYANHDWTGVQEYMNAVYVRGELPEVNASVEGCNNCHMENIIKHNAISATPVDQNGDVRPFFSCRTCHNDGHMSHGGIRFNDVNQDIRLRNSVHYQHRADYPQSVANCATCHDVDSVINQANFEYGTCMSCHQSFDNDQFTVPSYAPDHTNYDETTNCTGCHGDFAPTFSDLHSGYNPQKIASDGTRWSEKVKFQIDSIEYDNNTNELTVNWGAYENGVLIDLSDNSTYDFDTDNLTNETGAYVLVGYLGFGTNDVAEHAVLADNTTINENGSATSILTLDSATLSEYQVEGVKVGVLGVPAVNGGTGDDEDGTHIAVTSVTKNYNLETGSKFPTDLAVSQAKCNNCHNELIIHDSGGYRHGAVANPDACMLCHVPGRAAGHYNEQSSSLDTYLHAIHEGQPAPNGSQKHYPQPITNCESCHDSYNFPSMSTDLAVTLSGYELRTGNEDRATVDPEYYTGPQAAACGGCHKAYPIENYFAALMENFTEDTDNGTAVSEYLYNNNWNTFYNASGFETSSFNNHVATMGFYYDNSTGAMYDNYTAVLGAVDSGEILGESCGTCHTP